MKGNQEIENKISKRNKQELQDDLNELIYGVEENDINVNVINNDKDIHECFKRMVIEGMISRRTRSSTEGCVKDLRLVDEAKALQILDVYCHSLPGKMKCSQCLLILIRE